MSNLRFNEGIFTLKVFFGRLEKSFTLFYLRCQIRKGYNIDSTLMCGVNMKFALAQLP